MHFCILMSTENIGKEGSNTIHGTVSLRNCFLSVCVMKFLLADLEFRYIMVLMGHNINTLNQVLPTLALLKD